MGADLHVGDLEGDRLEAGDRLAEGLAFAGVAGALVDAALCGADGQRGDGDTALVEYAQEIGVTPPALAQQVLRGHPDVIEAQRVGVRGVPADLVVRGFGGESVGGYRHQD